MSNEKQTAIMTPVFDGTRYKHHVCSECKGEINLTQSCYGTVRFYELNAEGECAKIKFCPLCGAEVIRFSHKAIYEKPLDLTPLDIFGDLHREYERKAKWLYHCYISGKHRDQIDALVPLIEKGDVAVYYQDAIDLAKKGDGYFKVSSTALKKLRKEFGEETE